MSATIHAFPTPTPPPAAAQNFQRGDHVIIADYSWDNGETEIQAVVVTDAGEWVSVRVPDVGVYSVHTSVLHAVPVEPEAA